MEHKNYKAQQNIEYIVGFMIVLVFLVLMYVSFIYKYNSYGANINNKINTIKLNLITLQVYDHLIYSNGSINETFFKDLNCGLYNYYNINSVDCYNNITAFLKLSKLESIYLEGNLYYILIPEEINEISGYATGNIIINNTVYNFTLEKNMSDGFNVLNIEGQDKQNETYGIINIDHINYTINNIDYKGRYAIISRLNLISGIRKNEEIDFQHSSIYGNKLNGLEKIDIYYWG